MCFLYKASVEQEALFGFGLKSEKRLLKRYSFWNKFMVINFCPVTEIMRNILVSRTFVKEIFENPYVGQDKFVVMLESKQKPWFCFSRFNQNRFFTS